MELIDQFGGLRNIITLILFILIFLAANASIRNKYFRFLFSILPSIFIVAQAFSLYSTQSFIGHQFYIHMNYRGVLGMVNLFIPQITTLLIFFFTLNAAFLYSYPVWNKVKVTFKNDKITNIIKATILLTSSVIILSESDFMEDSMTLQSIITAIDSDDFDDVLQKYNMSDYVTPDKAIASVGKNIIVISMESLERGFLDKRHASLTPNLNRLKTQWNYLDINPNCGSSWTSGSLYTYLTGFPAFFGSNRNSAFEGSYHSNISSISELLGQSKYQTIYLNTNTNHSSTDQILNTFKFDKIIDKRNASKNNDQYNSGLRDKDLFSLAKFEVESLKESNSPFALFISTTDSHFPDGIYDKRMEELISPKNTGLEFAVASLDYLIGDFITYLNEKDILENTVVYIFPDHLKMGNPTIFKNTGQRKLYLITNAKDTDISTDSSDEFYQIDLPKIMLNGAEIKHNLKFLTDYISGDKNKFIRENINEITEINRTGLLRTNSKKYIIPKLSSNYENYINDTSRYIAHAGGAIDGYTYTNSLEALNFSYSKGFRLFELDIRKTIDGQYVAVHNWNEWKRMTGFNGKTPVTRQEFLKHKLHDKYTPLSLKEINDWFMAHQDAILVSDKINEPEIFSKLFIDPKRLIMELFTEQALKAGVKSGILSAMPSQNLIKTLTWEKVIDLKLKHVAVSRLFIRENKKLLKKLKENNIKVYVYNVNRDGGVIDSGMDEVYVTKYELDYVHGMYADKWDFE